MAHNPDTPDVIVFPPVLLGGTMILGALINWLWPLPLFPTSMARILGAALIVMGAAVGFAAVHALRRAGTNVRPDQPTLSVVTDGPYRWSRNPIYLAGLVVYLGVTALINGPAPVLLLFPMFALLRWGIVLREESYLSHKFGDAYGRYQGRVRRWL